MVFVVVLPKIILSFFKPIRLLPSLEVYFPLRVLRVVPMTWEGLWPFDGPCGFTQIRVAFFSEVEIVRSSALTWSVHAASMVFSVL